jgi:hypothetical protein
MIQSDTVSQRPNFLLVDDDKPKEVTLLPKERFIASLKLSNTDGIYNTDL